MDEIHSKIIQLKKNYFKKPKPNNVSSPIFISAQIFLWVVYFLETYLSIRQFRIYQRIDRMPHNLRFMMNEETFTKARIYRLRMTKVELVYNFISRLQLSFVLFFGSMEFLWIFCEKILKLLRITDNFQMFTTALFMAFTTICIISYTIPWDAYFTFYIATATSNFNSYMKSKLIIMCKAVILSAIVGVIIVMIIDICNSIFLLWIINLLFGIVVNIIYPDFIEPFLNDYVPLPDGNLKRKIEKLAEQIKFPLNGVLMIRKEDIPAQNNAFFYSFGIEKRVVLSDDILDYIFDLQNQPGLETNSYSLRHNTNTPHHLILEDDEILAVLCHEFGHWKLNHKIYGMLIRQINVIISCLLTKYIYEDELFEAFGFQPDENPCPIIVRIIIICQFIFLPLRTIETIVTTMMSRYFVFRADAFTVRLNLGEHLSSALAKLEIRDCNFPIIDPLYSLYYFSQPPTMERLKAINEEMQFVK